MQDSKLRSRLKAQLTKFSSELCGELSRPLEKFVAQMLFGIQASQDVKLSNIARSLKEEIPLIKTEDRLSRNLKAAELEAELAPQLAAMAGRRVEANTVLCLDLSDIRKEYARKMEYLTTVHDGSSGELHAGYWLCAITGAEVHGSETLPIYQKLYSTEAADFQGENEQILSAVDLVRNATEKHYVHVSQLVTVLLVIATGYVSAQLASIRSGWQVVLQIGAGTGSVYMLRWYWWRINAWSEISAMMTALILTMALHWEGLWNSLLGRPELFTGSSTVLFAKDTLTTTLLTTIVWVLVTLLTKPEPDSILISFYRKVRPDVRGWGAVSAIAPDITPTRDLGRNLWCWILGCVMVYSALFGVGKLLLHHYGLGIVLVAVATVSAWQMARELSRGQGAATEE